MPLRLQNFFSNLLADLRNARFYVAVGIVVGLIALILWAVKRFRVWPIYKRELRAYFQNPGLYVTLGIYVAVSGWFIFMDVNFFKQLSMNSQMMAMQGGGAPPVNFTEIVIKDMFNLMSFFLLFVVPLLTMRLFAEEKKSGTFELLASLPIRDWGLVLGKFLAAATIIVLFLLATAVFPLYLGGVRAEGFLSGIGKVEWPIVGAGYLALLFLGLAYTAFGVFASTLTENQIIAGVVTFFGLLAFYVIGSMAASGTELYSTVMNALSLIEHSQNMVRGRILSEDIFFFFAFTVGFLFLANYVLESRRWRV